MKIRTFTLTTLATVLATLLAFSSNGFAAKGGIPGKPTGGEATNNLSHPAIRTDVVEAPPAYWAVSENPVLGTHYSYGCDLPQSNGSFKYPNTSCVDNLDAPTTYYDAEQCVTVGNPCVGEEVSRIYWQKVADNNWWADDEPAPDVPEVAYIDWGDALEAVSWNERSVIRVETQPYSSTIIGFDPTAYSCEDASIVAGGDPATDCKVGLQMWHVSGQGITEHWGVRASADLNGEMPAGTSYNYDSPFQIIKSANVHLNLTKLSSNSAICSMPGGNPGDSSPLGEDGNWSGSEWITDSIETCTYYDQPYSVETSVGGKYVYGYNWRMKDVDLSSCGEQWLKTGFWRLTFYTTDGSVRFANPLAPNVAPPAVPSEVRELPRCDDTGCFNTVLAVPPPEPEIVLASEEEEDPTADDRLYRPVVDTVNNLSYLDICIVAKEGGKEGGGTGGKPTVGGKPGNSGGRP